MKIPASSRCRSSRWSANRKWRDRDRGNQIVAVGREPEVTANAADGDVTDLGEVALMPGLINAHCHLDYTVLRYAIHPPKSFSAWVQRLIAIKRGLSAVDYVRSITRGFDECVKWGTTSVCTIESFPEIMQHRCPTHCFAHGGSMR
jgi:cytosine/adenosine deaminase-related metal-dependent hydrolase